MRAQRGVRRPAEKIFLCGVSVFLVLAASFAFADDYPNKPINVYVGFAPGSSTGNAAHIFAEWGKKNLPNSQPMIINFKPGASAAVKGDAGSETTCSEGILEKQEKAVRARSALCLCLFRS